MTIHGPSGLAGFVSAVLAEVEGNLDSPIATICASGNRSTLAQEALRKAGFTNVSNVREGMLGGVYGPGWLKQNCGGKLYFLLGPVARLGLAGEMG